MKQTMYFLMQVKHTNGNWEKGVVVKDSLNSAKQSYHSYLGAYGYEKDANTDYVQVRVVDSNGTTYCSEIDDRRPENESAV